MNTDMEPISLEICLDGYNDLFAIVSRMYPKYADNILYDRTDDHSFIGESLIRNYFKN
jgi:hypothetical protein